MAGLLDFMNDPQNAGLLSAAAQMLAASGPSRTPTSFGQIMGGGLLAGMQGMQQAQDRQREGKLYDMKIKGMEDEMADKQKVRDFYGNIGQFMPSRASQALSAGAKMGSVGPTVANAELMEQMPEPQFDAGAMYRAMLQSGSPALAQMGLTGLSKDEAPMVVGEGGALVTKSGKQLFSNPKTEKPLELERMLNAAGITDPAQRANFLHQALIKQTTHAPASQVNNFLSTKETFKNERDLRNDFAGLPTTKAFKEVQGAYDQINFALKNPSAANDLAAATKFMKLLDPGSVVRESELGLAMAATGLLDRMGNYVNMLNTGQKLTPQQRADFYKSAEGLYSAATKRYNDTANEYRSIASDYQLNADRIAKPVTIEAKPSGKSVSGAKFLGFE